MARHGDCYNGKSAPHWYDAAQFRELLTASGDTPVREFIAQQLEGCSGARAGSIIAAARCGLERNLCRDVTKKQAERLLQIAKENTREVNPKRLGRIGADAWSDNSYAITSGTVDINSVSIPYVIEAWAIKDTRTDLFVYVNRTPITGKINAARDKRDIDAYGCGLADNIATAPKDEQFEIKLSIITPFMPITSDGKEPNLDPFLSGIDRVVRKAVNAARSPKRSSTSINRWCWTISTTSLR